MKIISVNIDEDFKQGLGHINMSRLNQHVIIAGKNGSGKSRLLEKIKTTYTKKLTIKQTEEIKKNLENHNRLLNSRKNQLQSLQNAIYKGNGNAQVKQEHEKIKSLINSDEKAIKTLNEKLNWNEIITSENSNNYTCINFVPKNLKLKDCNAFNKIDMDLNAKKLDQIGIDNASDCTLSKIQYIQNQWFNATHQNSTIDQAKKQEIIQSYENLRKYIKLFLNTDLDRNENNDATLFGFRLGESKLSDGQNVLLQLCTTIYSQSSKLDELIIFLDEPENHLHPEALIEVIDKLTEIVKNGQLWIATHSINLLAHINPSDIWYMENGMIKYSGNLPQQVLTGLIGNENEIGKLATFLSLPAQMATTQFTIECLFEPQVVMTGEDDPQTNQIISAVNKLKEDNEKIRVLDFGAGKGRLLSTIKDLSNNNKVSEWLDYYAYDLPSDDKQICQQVIDDIYEEDNKRYFDKEDQLLESIELNSFDLIVMCNVFHEIDPKNWLNLFSPQSLICSLLKKDGTLLIVEDQLLKVGEKAYANGFLVFDKLQFKKLFTIDNYHSHDQRNDGRLKAHFLPTEVLTNISQESRIDAIENLKYNAETKVKELRDSAPSYKNGQLHGFWIHQLANSQLILSELKNN